MSSAKNVKISVSDITNPPAKMSSYAWAVRTMRF